MLLDKDNNIVKINNPQDVFKLAGCADCNGKYAENDIELEGGNLFNSVAELFKNGFNRVKNLITNPFEFFIASLFQLLHWTFGVVLGEI